MSARMSTKILNAPEEMQQFLADCRQGFALEKVPLSACKAWRFVDGAIKHDSGGYFSVVAVGFDEDAGFPQAFLYQPQSALNGLAVTTLNGEPHFLIQARVEPGNYQVAQFGPTVQSTPANYLRVHGGRATDYLDLFFGHDSRVNLLHDSTQLDLGGRYFKKNKRLVIVEVPPELPTAPNFAWLPSSVLRQAVGVSATLNTDLRSMFSVMPWDTLSDAFESAKRAGAQASLEATPRPEVIGRILSSLVTPPKHASLRPLAEARDWELTDWGLEASDDAALSVDFFRVTAPGREVQGWSQPLLNSKSTGSLRLFCRERGGLLEVLVRRRAEPGLSTANALFPTWLSYPGEGREDEASCAALLGARQTALFQTLESDEGGRFYMDKSAYELVFVEDATDEAGADSWWLQLSELKLFLRMSNICSIQLRCITSMLLGV